MNEAINELRSKLCVLEVTIGRMIEEKAPAEELEKLYKEWYAINDKLMKRNIRRGRIVAIGGILLFAAAWAGVCILSAKEERSD